MLLLRKFRKSQSLQSFYYSTVTLDSSVEDALEKELYKPKIHPGVVKPRFIEVPDHITAAIKKSIRDYPPKDLISDGEALSRYLYGRKAPLEEDEVHKRKNELEQDVLNKIGQQKISYMETEDPHELKKFLSRQVDNLYYTSTYLWKPIIYDGYKAMTYAMGRAALEYAVVQRIFNEIAHRHPDFKPRSFFDFGAGVGTGTWAASQLWKQSLYEYFLVDSSREMNDLSELILRDGDANKNMTLKNVYYRQFLPASNDVKFNLVLSAYTLMELPDIKTRIETLLNLWNKCDGYLVLVEQGSGAGFKMINEARDFFKKHLQETKSGFIYAPCPHEKPCPRFMDSKDKTPCNFLSKHQPLRIGQPREFELSLYSYLVLKKGDRSSEGSSIEWPRVVRPILIASRRVICRTCTHRGELEQFDVTKGKNTKWTYRCARKTEWGDRLPYLIEDGCGPPVTDEDNFQGNEEHSGDTLDTDTLTNNDENSSHVKEV